jgi:transcriptional regulator with XRE-family HTH domain
MDGVRIGRIVRALRRRRGWRQDDLAQVAGISQSMVSLIERGHIDHASVSTLRKVLATLDASLFVDIRWRGGEIDRLLDERHATLAGLIIAELRRFGWDVRTEATYSHFGERGSFDILAWHAATRTLLVIEIKSELTSAEATLRKLDEKLRLAPIIARQRFGWSSMVSACLLVIGENSTDRRRVDRHATLFAAALPMRGHGVRKWLRTPHGSLRGLWFLSSTDRSGRRRDLSAPQRVRRRPPVAA